MGSGIAITCSRAGYTVSICDISDEVLERTKQLIQSGRYGVQGSVDRGKITVQEAEAILDRINYSTSLEVSAKEADIVIEAVTEDAAVKKKVLSDLEHIVSPNTVLASNTSGIMISELASALSAPERFIGMHWFWPAQVMKPIEIVKGFLTSEETCSLVEAFSIKLGKTPVVRVSDGPGFFTTRFIFAFLNEAFNLFELGISNIKDIDEMCKSAFGFPMGPFELSDGIGLDTNLHGLEYLYEVTGDLKYKPSVTLKKMVQSGFIGDPKVKIGSRGGWYTYYGVVKNYRK